MASSTGRPSRSISPAGVCIRRRCDRSRIGSAAASVAADVDAAGFDDVILVGHSLAGCSMPATIGLLGDRVRHAVFVACTVPDHGSSAIDMLPADLQTFARANLDADPGVLSPELAKGMFGNDLDDAQFAWMLEQMVPEAPGLITEPVDLSPLRSPVPRTWVRPLHDAIVDPDTQLRFTGNVGDLQGDRPRRGSHVHDQQAR